MPAQLCQPAKDGASRGLGAWRCIVLEDIARPAGVAIGTLYRHFPTRQDLLVVSGNSFCSLCCCC
ncbi:MAG TPA: helix-turn-helix domain-containing protein [Ktedonobacteraceae bacterium]|nr:helix-turn-helix domain-containing protein [Ktedonobacteraceae bacterium]